MGKAFMVIMIFSFLVIGCDPGNTGVEPIPPETVDRRLTPADLEYQGGFRLPRDTSGDSWEWSGTAGGMAFRPDGDPGGGDDGYPGSLYITGHAWRMQVAEVSIPAPAVSADAGARGLPEAETIQNFHPVPGRLWKVEDLEIMRAGLAFVPADTGTPARLFFCCAQHIQEDGPSHGCCGPELSRNDTWGPWRIGNLRIYSVNDYLFRIPRSWARRNTPGMFLVTGRFRDGGWSGQGPSLVALGTDMGANLPDAGSRLDALPLLMYTSTEDYDAPQFVMEGYHHSDEWSGGAWIEFSGMRAVIFVGTKGRGNCWYGDRNGPCLDCREERGWWSDRFEGGFLFYDPDDFAAVARGEAAPHEPQPYDFMVVDARLFHVNSQQEWHHLGPCAWDESGGYFYVAEPHADGDRSVIHVWKVRRVD